MMCMELSDSYLFCTLDADHAGAHIATAFGNIVVDTWADDAEPEDCERCGGELVIPVTDLSGLTSDLCSCAPPLDDDTHAALVAAALARMETEA